MSPAPRLGLSGRLAAAFQDNPLTPVLALAGLLLGLAAALVTPREEEPQIDVTFANVFVPFPGAAVADVENLVAFPLEQKLAEIEGVKHVYSVSRPGIATLTVEFEVGLPRRDAILRLYNQVYSNLDFLPPELGAGPPLVRPMGIDDVPVMALTLWTDDPARGATELAEVAHALEAELKRVPGTRDVYTLGAPERAVLVEFDPAKLAAYGLALDELATALAAANVVRHAGERVADDRVVPVTAGTWLADADDVAGLAIGTRSGRPVHLEDVARIERAADLPSSYVWHGVPAGRSGPVTGVAPAVTLAVAKKPGSNAADITRAIERRIEALKGLKIPEGVMVEITRDYGRTASDKAAQLIQKLAFATLSVVMLVLVALGRREAVVVGAAVVLTLALTLAASYFIGFTINRVSLFALIFSIGILVDDAIVVVENIHRHHARTGMTLRQAIPPAVDEVGGPTILATFTVIAALLPMAFVSGLMGPYMRPIPINASAGMLLSLAVALVVTPWLALRLLAAAPGAGGGEAGHDAAPVRLMRLFERLLRPFLAGPRAGVRRRTLYALVLAALLGSVGLAAMQAVILKMLPFDNKSEFQVVVDMPEGATLEATDALLRELARELDAVPEVASFQGYAGTAAPVNFNGLVRQYYLRRGATVGDLQVNLVDRNQRARQSHEIARKLRPRLAAIGARRGAAIKLTEVPPGPPVMAPIVAEVYGPDPGRVAAVASALAERAAGIEGLVDIDTTLEADAPREVVVVDRERAARYGITQQAIVVALETALAGHDATWLRDGAAKYPVPVRLRLAAGDQAAMEHLLALKLAGAGGVQVPLSELVELRPARWERSAFHKDLLPVALVFADEAGAHDSPLYGMFALVADIAGGELAGQRVEQYFFRPPEAGAGFAIQWTGEWQVTWETFRDMGLAYSVGLVLIYLLVVAQFRSYIVPLVIMVPIPLTVIGVMPGHALLGAQFTATSMIGMIALAGIIVRNSILLVDFVNHASAAGRSPADAVIEAAAVRAKPIALTAAAAMLGAVFILDDPIFNGLAVSLLFGILVSTLLTLVVIPLLYHAYLARRVAAVTDPSAAA